MDSQATLALIGASGCVSGLLAAYLMLKPCEPVAITLPGFDVRLATYWAVGGWILLQLFQFLWHADEESFATLAQAGGADRRRHRVLAAVPARDRIVQMPSLAQ